LKIKLYNTLCRSTTVLAAEFGWFGRCFTQPRPLAKLCPQRTCLVRLARRQPRPSQKLLVPSSIILTIPIPQSRSQKRLPISHGTPCPSRPWGRSRLHKSRSFRPPSTSSNRRISRTLDESRGLGCDSLLHEDSLSLFSPRYPLHLYYHFAIRLYTYSSFAHLLTFFLSNALDLEHSTVLMSSPRPRHLLRPPPLQRTLEVYSLLAVIHISTTRLQLDALHTTVDSQLDRPSYRPATSTPKHCTRSTTHPSSKPPPSSLLPCLTLGAVPFALMSPPPNGSTTLCLR